MIVIGCGSRKMPVNENTIKQAVEILISCNASILIEGGASGADTVWKLASESIRMEYLEVPAEWNKYGNWAGPMRNQKMIEKKPDLVLAFIPRSGITKGTKDMVSRAKKNNIPVKIITYEGNE